MESKIHILSTSPLPGRLVNNAKDLNIVLCQSSLIHTEKKWDDSLQEQFNHLLSQQSVVVFTSMNAVDSVCAYLVGNPLWKIFCIGNATKKKLVHIFGSGAIAGYSGNASLLAELIIRQADIIKIVFFCGDQRRDELPDKLTANGIEVEELVVYSTIKTPSVFTKKYDGILFFSPSAVESFFSVNNIYHSTKLFAIGTTTAETISKYSEQEIIIAKEPGKENLVQLAIEYFSITKLK